MTITLFIISWLIIGFLSHVFACYLDEEDVTIFYSIITTLMGGFTFILFLVYLFYYLVEKDKTLFSFKDKEKNG